MSYRIKFTKQAVKDYEKIKKSPLSKKAKVILKTLEETPYNCLMKNYVAISVIIHIQDGLMSNTALYMKLERVKS